MQVNKAIEIIELLNLMDEVKVLSSYIAICFRQFNIHNSAIKNTELGK